MSHRTQARRVIVGVDGSANSAAALRYAVRKAIERHAVLEVVYVVDAPERAENGIRSATAHARSCLQRHTHDVLGNDNDIPLLLKVVEGDPAEELSRLAERAELLVVGCNRADPNRPLSGDTVPDLLTNSPCEVVVCAGRQLATSASDTA